MNQADFSIVETYCVGCGNCTMVCPGGLLFLNDQKKAGIRSFAEFGWNGCWKCEHCLSVCPTGAIQIFGHRPEDSLKPENTELSSLVLDALIANRHSCRRFLSQNVDREIVTDILSRLGNAPNGGNKQQVEFTLIDDMAEMQILRDTVRLEMERLAQNSIFPDGFDECAYSDMKRWERTVRPDMLFCGAPHLLIPHAPMGAGTPVQDVIIAGTYFELLCASRGLGCVMLTFPLDAMKNMPNMRQMLGIPEDHYIGMMLGFGYPQIPYRRGSQRNVEDRRIHRLRFRRD